MLTYSISSSRKTLTVITELSAPRYSQKTCHSFLKGGETVREFAKGLRDGNIESVLKVVLGLASVDTGLFGGVFAMYKQGILDKIVDYSDKYPGVYVKVSTSQYGTFYKVEPWRDTTEANITLLNSGTSTEKVVKVI
ncbi:hypothetical protein IZY60_14310 [Lutibacter sp. B2]|nr:hypothetical protein [Lutibacter sp. B2]